MYSLNTVDRHAVCYDARGNGEGRVAPTLTGDHQDRVTDYTAVCVQLTGDRDNPNVGISDTAYCVPANPMSDRGQAVCVGEPLNLNKDDFQSKTVLDPKGITPALYSGETRGGGGEMYVLATQQGGAEIGETQCPTITASAGMSGNNQPVLCVRERCGCEGGAKDC